MDVSTINSTTKSTTRKSRASAGSAPGSPRRFRTFPWTALLLVAVLLAGCADGAGGLLPPRADVDGIQTVLVFAFSDEANRPGLAADVTDGIVTRLRDVGWYDVLDPERTETFIAEARLLPADMTYDSAAWQETARDIALTLDADGFILGALTDYDESVEVGVPYRARRDDDVLWLVDQTTDVRVTVTAKLMDAHTGTVAYERTATGAGRVVEARQLNWVIPEDPPANIVPPPHRRDLPLALDWAVEDAIHRLTEDILPRAEGNGDTNGDDGDADE